MGKENIKDNRFDDTVVVEAVQSLRVKVPQALDERLDKALDAADEAKVSSRQRFRRRRYSWYPAAALVTAALLIAVAIFVIEPFFKEKAMPVQEPIEEIRTELELADQNIKIIWFVKKDFQLRRKPS